MDFWRDTLGAPTKIVAPMVDASELPWRLLSRKYGAQLCYTPMLHSAIFARDAKYRNEALASCEIDKPLIVQFCGNDPKVMLEAALLAQDHCCAIDINLGCPQAIAKRGHYGAFLQDEWPLLHEIVSLLSQRLKVPITCKVRRFESVEKTVDYAKMLVSAGCKMLTVHGRTREQKGPLTGLADWSYVKAVREAVDIPVISNGNIQCMQDVDRCLEETGAVGVMTAEGNLYNPALFMHQNPPAWEPALEYLNLVDKFPCPLSYIRGHLFKLFHHVLSIPKNNDLRIQLGAANTLEEFKRIVNVMKDLYEPFHQGTKLWQDTTERNTENLILPPWLCQPYVRVCPEEHLKRVEENSNKQETKRQYEDSEGNQISRKKMKKLRRISRRPQKPDSVPLERNLIKCANCVNPLGSKCIYQLCKKCCKDKCFLENLDCAGHRILVKTRREMAKFYARKDNTTELIDVS
ncbi:tRNA-dihydrouridine(16/17) synthase [NAD(P)(+)]-like [Tribolium castaneum]|uniref:tRNA-dihydrouridine(16/17) synthase [NAD(P)(+)] n=1 Tax=Tribolium castaneum TaxID=7070 RepID=D6WDX9_TRICA|nr:PREDICTED: tRNA-dihydrouridine(16/17) synthase [NAD(P)(+)]-like [Tribolium castaneum]EFA01195.1 tRNA-dihydrouridine(16/17) synthase [NAD(P)(+)]-like [Tribolium castaneum]|eukprot:XP_967539.1 PREDICTED: tRNA-dihydrouridine(16/17) synthase [NAD(P)(+)]-like [Tribolium castaneum]